MILVSRPESASLREAERIRGELTELGVSNLHLAINGIFSSTTQGDAGAMTRRGVEALCLHV